MLILAKIRKLKIIFIMPILYLFVSLLNLKYGKEIENEIEQNEIEVLCVQLRDKRTF